MKPNIHRHTMLVVDDVTTNIDILCRILSPLYQVKAATNGQKALSIINSDAPPDLILLDVMMPDMDGYELCRRIKSDPKFRHIPMIFVTSMEEEKHEEYGLSLGAQDYITKPFQPAIVLARVNTQLALYDNARELEKQINFTAKANLELRDAMEQLESAHAKIAQAERMTALGAMVSGIAHELNTPIGNCILAASMLETKSAQFDHSLKTSILRSELNQYAKDVGEGCNLLLRNLHRSADLIKNFKHLAANQGSSDRHRFDLESFIVDATAESQRVLSKRGIQLITELESGLVLDSYPDALYDILSHLMKNALLHAFPEDRSGEILISTQRITADIVKLRFSDNGAGIPSQNLGRVFDPFFTTKFGTSSGLGLNIVHNLVTYVLGGRISAASNETGSDFIINLPLNAPVLTETGGD